MVGEKEAADKTVNVNDRDGRAIGNMTLERFIDACGAEIESKGRIRNVKTSKRQNVETPVF